MCALVLVYTYTVCQVQTTKSKIADFVFLRKVVSYRPQWLAGAGKLH